MTSNINIEKCCYYCEGLGLSGQEDGSKCFSCDGSGLAKDQDKLKVICDTCTGDGYQDYTLRQCFRCHGTGWHYKSHGDKCELDKKYSRTELYLITKGDECFTILSKYNFTDDVNIYLDEGMYQLFPSKRKSDMKTFQVAKYVHEDQDYFFPCFKACNSKDGIVLRSVKIATEENSTQAGIRVYALPQ